MTAEDYRGSLAAYALGQKIGRERALEEIVKLLGLDELIAKAIAQHEVQYHDAD